MRLKFIKLQRNKNQITKVIEIKMKLQQNKQKSINFYM